jgi:hypothetical protein
MKLTVLILAALLPLTSCIFVPDHRGDGGPPHGDDREHHEDRDHCDHDGHCDHDR